MLTSVPVVYNSCMDGNILVFPKNPESAPSKVLHLKLVHQAYIIDLTEMRRRIASMRQDIAQTKRRLIKAVPNANDQGET